MVICPSTAQINEPKNNMGNIKYYLTIAVIAIVAVEVWARIRGAMTPASK